jgi:hypothetical protein
MRAGNENADSKSILLLSYNEATLTTGEQRGQFRRALIQLPAEKQEAVLAAQSRDDLQRLFQSLEKYPPSDRINNKPLEERITAVMAAKAKLSPMEQIQQQDIAKKRLPESIGMGQSSLASDEALITMASTVLKNGTADQFIQEQANRLGIQLHGSVGQISIKSDDQNKGMFLITVASEFRGRSDQVTRVARSDLDQMVRICMAHAVNTSVVRSQPAPPVDRSYILNEKFSRTGNPKEFIESFNKLSDKEKRTVLAKQRVVDLQQLTQVEAISANDKQTISEMAVKIKSGPLAVAVLVDCARQMLANGKDDAYIQTQAHQMGLGLLGRFDSIEINQVNPLHFEVVLSSDNRAIPSVRKNITQEQLSQFVRGCLSADSLITAQQASVSALTPVAMPAASVTTPLPVTSESLPVIRKPLPPLPAARAAEPVAVATSLLSTGISGLTQRAEKALQDLKQAGEKLVASKGNDLNATSSFDSCVKTLTGIKNDISQFARMCGKRDEQRQSNSLINKIDEQVKSFTDTIKNIVRPSQNRH